MKQLTKLQNFLYRTGGILLLAGLILWIPRIAFAPYIYCIGALLFAAMQMQASYEGKNFTIKRLRRQQIIGALCLVLAGAVMLAGNHDIPYCRRNEWVVVLMIGCLFEIYTAFRIPAEMEKEKKAGK